MNATTIVGNVLTVVASVAAGCAAAISIASTAAVTEASPVLRQQAAQTEIVRLEPVVVTISKQAYETVRNEERAATELARANAVAKTRRG